MSMPNVYPTWWYTISDFFPLLVLLNTPLCHLAIAILKEANECSTLGNEEDIIDVDTMDKGKKMVLSRGGGMY